MIFINVLIFCQCLLILLVLGHQVVEVGLGLCELHLIHALASVPVEEGLPPEHGGELLRDSFEDLLDGGGVTNEGGGHLETSWWDVTDTGHDIVGDPFNEVGRVLVLDVEHLLVNFLHGHSSSEASSHGEVSTMSWITGGHHVLSVKHLLGKLWNSDSSVLHGTASCQWSKSRHEEVESGEWNHVDRQLPEVSIELTWEPEASGHSRHGQGDQMVEVTIGGGGKLQGSEADVIESLVVNTIGLISVLNQLVNREGGVVGLYHGVRNLGGWNDGVGVHDSVRILLSDFGDEKCSHSRSSSASKGMSQLESLETVASLSLLSDNIEDTIHQLSALGVVTLGPVVASSRLSEHKVVGSEDASVWTRPHTVHGSWLQVHQDCSWYKFASGCQFAALGLF